MDEFGEGGEVEAWEIALEIGTGELHPYHVPVAITCDCGPVAGRRGVWEGRWV